MSRRRVEARHGTFAGYKHHKNNNTPVCDECRQAHRIYERQRYRANIEHRRQLAKIRSAKPEHKAYIREYKKKNKEHILNLQRVYVAANREKVAAQKKQWKIDNSARNLEHNRKAERARRARLKNSITTPYTESQVISTYGINCNICGLEIDFKVTRQVGKKGWQMGLHIDHLVPISKGGQDTLDNVRPTHGLCNLRKSNST